MYLKLFWLTSTQKVLMSAYVAGLCDYSFITERNNSSSIFSVFFHWKCCRLMNDYASIVPVLWLGKAVAPVFFSVITGNMAHQAADCAALIPVLFNIHLHKTYVMHVTCTYNTAVQSGSPMFAHRQVTGYCRL
jgi:hypothetical protein